MLKLIIGGSGSGKSALAEQMLSELADVKYKYYLATMQILDEEGEEKAKRHQKLREGKGFLTIEQPRDILQARFKMREGTAEERIGADAGEKRRKECAVLLECMSNLTANEMFGDKQLSADKTVRKIIEDIRKLRVEVKHLILVTNNVFEDGESYDSATLEYLRALAGINRQIALEADQVVEVIAGIPVILRERETGNESD